MQGYSPVTVTSVMKLLSLLLSDAVDERLIPVNPIRARHRGRRRSDRRVERLWATPSQVLAVAGPIRVVAFVIAWIGPGGRSDVRRQRFDRTRPKRGRC